MATYKNQDGTNAADNLTYDKGGSGVVYHTGAGADKVSILADAISLVNDSGSAAITVTGGAGHNITGTGSSVETITLNGGNALEAQLGSGKDVVIITNSNGRKSTGGSSAIRGGDWTDTFTTEEGAQNYQLYGDAGNDVFNVNGGKNMNFWGGAANDTFIVKGGTNNKLYGGDSADIFEIYAAKQNMILGYGNDTVNINVGDEQQIKANLGINTINLLAGARHVITADIDQVASNKAGKDVGYGVDKLFLNGATYVTANLGDGKDEVNVSRGYGHKIYTEGWGDTINISGTASNNLFDAGDGDDIINISGGNNNTVVGGSGNDIYTITNLKAGNKYTIDNFSKKGAEKDVLNLPDNALGEFTWAKEQGNFVLTHTSTGAAITVQGWEKNPLQKIVFKDGLLVMDSTIKTNVNFEVAEEGDVNNKTAVVDGNAVITGSLTLAQAKNGNASGNIVNILSGTINNYNPVDQSGGEIVAGKVNGDGQANNNIVTMSGGEVTYIRGGRATGSGEASHNKTTVTGGKLVAADGGYSNEGKADYNEVTVTGGSFASIDGFAARILGGRSSNGEANNNTVKVSNVLSPEVSIYGGQGNASNGSARANDNTVSVENSEAQLVAGGFANGMGAAVHNVVTLKDTKVSADLETAEYVAKSGAVPRYAVVGGFSNGANTNRNEVSVEGGQVSAVYGGVNNSGGAEARANNNQVTLTGDVVVNYNVYGGMAKNVSGNTVIIDGAIITGYDENVGGGDGGIVMAGAALDKGNATENTILMKSGEAYMLRGGRAVNGTADGNKITLDGGTVDFAEGGRSNNGTASNNIVTITGGEVTSNVRAGRVVGKAGADLDELPLATGNQAIINGGKVNKVYGGFATNAGNIVGNSVEIKDAQVIGNVWGGYTKLGEAKENTVVIGGTAVVEGNVYDSVGSVIAETDNGGSITLKDSAEVKGIINGSAGVDTIDIEGGKATSIEAKAGNDIINIKAGQVASISAGSGDDTITITGGVVGAINGGGGNDTIYVIGVDSLTMAGGAGSDTYTFTELKAGQKYIINNADFAEGDADRLVLDKYNKDDFEYALEDGIAVITHKATGATITINGWEDNAIAKVAFLDGEVPGQSLFTTKTLVIDDGKTYGDVGFLELDPYEKKPGSDYSVILKDGIVDTITGRYLEQGEVNNNTVVMEGGIVTSSVTGAEADNGNAIGNTVDIKGGFFGPARGQEVIVTGGLSHTGNASNNIVNISSDYENRVAIVMGGLSGMDALEGKANNNKVTLSGNVQGGRIIGGTSINNSANGNEVILQENVNVSEVSGGVGGAGEASNNKITVKGQANVFTLTAGSLAEVNEGKLENNEVIIGENAKVQWVAAASTSDSYGMTVSGNKVSLSGEAVVEHVNCANISDSLDSEVSNNQVIMDGGTVTYNIIAGSNESLGGKALNNSVVLSGNALVLGDVTASLSAFNTETDNMGSVTVNDQAEVKGKIFGDNGIDTIIINGGTVNAISTGGGDDIIEINGGTVTTIDGCGGNNSIHVAGGTVGLLDGGMGADTIIVDDGKIHTLNGGMGSDTIIIRGGSVDTVTDFNNNLSGDDIIEISGGTVGYVSGAQGDDTITVTGGSVGTVDGSYGNDTFNFSGVESLTAKGGEGSDIYNFTALASNQAYIIDNSGNASGDADTLDLSEYKYNEFSSAMNEGNLVITHKKTNATITIKDYDKNVLGEAKFQDATLTGQQLKNLDKILIIDDGKTRGNVTGKSLADGDIEGYSVVLKDGNTGYIIVGRATNGTVSNNSLLIEGGTASTMVMAAYGNNNGPEGVAVVLKDNEVTITGGTINGNVYGASNWNGTASNNTVVIKGDAVVTGLVYGGYSDTDKALANHIGIEGDAVVKGNIRSSYGKNLEATDDMGSITIGGNATIEGVVYGGDGKDEITINGGKFTNTSGGNIISAGGGDDTVKLQAGSNLKLSGGNGDDNFLISGGEHIYISGGVDNDITETGGFYSRGNDKFTITGGTDITINGGSENDIFEIQGGDQLTLIGDYGNDTYRFNGLDNNGHYTIDQSNCWTGDQDFFDFTNFDRSEFDIKLEGDSIVMTHAEGAEIKVENWYANGDSLIRFSDGEDHSWEQLVNTLPEATVTNQVDVMKNLLAALSYTSKTGFEAMDEAVAYASLGKYENLKALVDEFKAACINISTPSTYKSFLEEYCGMVLDNEDTGAITGADAGGPVVKTASSVVEEPAGITVEDFVCDRSTTITALDYSTWKKQEFYGTNVNGITLYWSDENLDNMVTTRGYDKANLEQIVGGVLNAWAEGALNLIDESYGLSMTDSFSKLQRLEDGSRGMQVELFYDDSGENKNTLAYVSSSGYKSQTLEVLRINTKYYHEALTDVDGSSPNSKLYLDRLIAHEMVHGVMAANIDHTGELPSFIKEGLSELVHGIDEYRTSSIKMLVNSDNYRTITDNNGKIIEYIYQADTLDRIFDLEDPTHKEGQDYTYAGGYTMLHYMAKQVADAVAGFSDGMVASALEVASTEEENKPMVFGNN